MRSRSWLAAAVLALIAACSAGSDDPPGATGTLPPASPRSEPDTPAETAVDAGGEAGGADPDVVPLPAPPDGDAIVDGVANGLVLVLGEESLRLVQVDGTEVVTLPSDGPVLQPVWAPDGRRVAWVQSADGVEWELVHTAVDGTDRVAVTLPGRPDYLAFDPTASRVTALTASPLGFGLVVVESESGSDAEPRLVDAGQPYFTDFAPDGERAVAHVGADVRLVDVTAEEGSDDVLTPLAGPSTTHQTPQWHPTDEVVVYSADGPAGGRLVQRDLDAQEETLVAEFTGFVLFDLDPSGERVAVSTFAGAEGDGEPRALRQQQPTLPGGLSVVDLDGDASIGLTEQPTSAPSWDPTGTKVLVRDALSGIGRWSVYDVDDDPQDPAVTDPLSVDQSPMPVYLRFWDQYVRSHTVWSPDGGHFVHVGAAQDGRAGVWVHDAETSGPSAYLTDGDFAAFSPT